MGQILIQIRANAALGRVDLQPGENGQCLRLLPAALPFLGVGVFVVGNDAAIQCGVADLADAGGEGTADRFEAGLPVVGAADLRLDRGESSAVAGCATGKIRSAAAEDRDRCFVSTHSFKMGSLIVLIMSPS